MIDNAGILKAVEEWKAHNPDCKDSTEDIYLNLVNAVAIFRDGKIVTEKPKVYAREQRAHYRQKPYSILLNGLHVDLKIWIEWPKTVYARNQKTYVRGKSEKIETEVMKDPVYPGCFDSIVITETNVWPTTKLKTPIVYPSMCHIQAQNVYDISAVAKRYTEIIPEQDQLELVQKRKALQAEHDRLVPIQSALALAKKVGNAKTRLTNKRIQKLADNYLMNDWVQLGASTVHELIMAFTKWQPRE